MTTINLIVVFVGATKAASLSRLYQHSLLFESIDHFVFGANKNFGTEVFLFENIEKRKIRLGYC